MMSPTSFTRLSKIFRNTAIGTAALAAVAALIWLCIAPTPPKPDSDFQFIDQPIADPPPPVHLMGWAGEVEAKAAWAKLAHKFPRFAIKNARADSAGKRVVLWDCSQKVLGKHVVTLDQQIGDCISMGATNALRYLQLAQIAMHPTTGPPVADAAVADAASIGIADAGSVRHAPGSDWSEYHDIFPPYIYGVSRVQIGGGKIRGDGSVGSWAVDGCKQYGAIANDAAGCPKYSGSLARSWGKSGPPKQFIDLGKQHLLQTASQVTSYAQARDALANYYPVTVASDQGFRMQGKVEGGKLWGIPSGSWAHQMCFIGVDDTCTAPNFAGGGKGALYCQNSWGDDVFGTPPDGAPPGGFWVASKVADRMLRQGDSFAWSNFAGFPARELDLTPLGAAPARRSPILNLQFAICNLQCPPSPTCLGDPHHARHPLLACFDRRPGSVWGLDPEPRSARYELSRLAHAGPSRN